MQPILFKSLLEDKSKPQYGVLNEEDNYSYITSLECGNVYEYGDYEILKRLSWSDIKIVPKKKRAKKLGKYVVCMKDTYVRDAEMLDTSELSDEEFNDEDFMSSKIDEYWKDIFPIPFITIIEAKSEKEACQNAAKHNQYDSRCLYAIKI